MSDREWSAVEASAKFRAFQAEQDRLHEERKAKRKAERDASRKAAKVVPPTEYPWMKDKQ